MVKTTKPTVAAAAAPATPAPAAPKKAAGPKKAAAPKDAAPAAAAPAPVVAAPVAAAPAPVVAAPVAAPVEKAGTDVLLTTLVAKIQQASSLLASLKADTKDLQKQIAHDRKLAEKAAKKSGKRKSRREATEGGEAKARNSGFMKPVRISDELASFLGKSKGTVMGRHEANAEIRTYVANNNLKETAKGKGRNINPDSKLMGLLQVPAGVQLDYFNLQKYMKPHFIKIEETASA